MRKLLTLDDLYNFYKSNGKSMNFCSKNSENDLAVQVKALLTMSSESDGLMYTTLHAFHDLTNNNNSHIKTDVIKEKMFTLKDRPILANIVEKVNNKGERYKDFNDHDMIIDDKTNKITYIERPIGHFVNPENIRLEYDEELERNFVISDAVIYEEYTEACDIIRRRKTVDCSVEIIIKDMSWNADDNVLVLNDFYIQGCTLLGSHIKPGMTGSHLEIQDFSINNNSIFSNLESQKDYKNKELDENNVEPSSLNINSNTNRKEENVSMLGVTLNSEETIAETTVVKNSENATVEEAIVVEETVVETQSTDEDNNVEETVVINSDNADETTDDKNSEDTVEDTTTVEEAIVVEETVVETQSEEVAVDETPVADTFSKTFSLSHDDIRHAIYKKLEVYEVVDDTCYCIISVYDNYFVLEDYGNCGSIFYGQKYKVENDEVVFVDEKYKLYPEFLTESEKTSLQEMRDNYPIIESELSVFKKNEELKDKMSVFSDAAYSNYLDRNEFKELMKEDTLLKYSKDELMEKADAVYGKIKRQLESEQSNLQTFSHKEEVKENNFFAFAMRDDSKNSFLDGLLK